MNATFTPTAKWLVVALVGLVWFTLLGYRDLAEPDEGRYAEIPREMVASGDWVTPRLNGFKYFEKPALQYWMTAASFQLLGESNATARLWVALIAFAGALWVMYIGRRLWGEAAGMYAFLFLGSSLLYAVLGHFITLDMTLSVFLALAIGALLLAQSERGNSSLTRNWMLFGWAALGLAVLTKGLIGLVLPGGAILVYSIWQRDWAIWRNLHIGKGLAVLLLVTAPWFVAVSMANPEFPEFFFVHEHFDRYTTTVHKRNQPAWYFIPILLVGMLPWLGSGLSALVRPGFDWVPANAGQFDPLRFLWVFTLFTLLFFSAGSSMLPAYILPVFPALALIMGRQLSRRPGLTFDMGVFFVLGAVLLVVGAFAHLFETERLPLGYIEDYRRWVFAAAMVNLIGVFLVWRRFSSRIFHTISALSLIALLSTQLLIWGYQDLGAPRTSRELAEVIRPYTVAGAPVYGVQMYPQSLPFYLGQTINLAISQGELQMGIEQEPEKWISDWATFLEVWQSQAQAVAVFEVKDFRRLDTSGMPMKVIYQDPRKLAVVRQ